MTEKKLKERKQFIEQYDKFWRNLKKDQKVEHYTNLFSDQVYQRIYRYSPYKGVNYHGIVKIEEHKEAFLKF